MCIRDRKFVDFGEASAELIFFELQQPLARVARVAFGREIGGLLLELKIFGFALQLFGDGSVNLRGESMEALADFAEQGIDASEDGGCGAVALFERRYPGHALRTRLSRIFAPPAQDSQKFLGFCDLLFELGAGFAGDRNWDVLKAFLTSLRRHEDFL